MVGRGQGVVRRKRDRRGHGPAGRRARWNVGRRLRRGLRALSRRRRRRGFARLLGQLRRRPALADEGLGLLNGVPGSTPCCYGGTWSVQGGGYVGVLTRSEITAARRGCDAPRSKSG